MFLRSAELNEGTLLRANLFARGVFREDTGVNAIVAAEQDDPIEVLGDCYRSVCVCQVWISSCVFASTRGLNELYKEHTVAIQISRLYSYNRYIIYAGTGTQVYTPVHK